MGLRTLVDLDIKGSMWHRMVRGRRQELQWPSGQDSVRVLGTLVRTRNRQDSCGSVQEGQEEIIVRGGKGGWGNQHFATRRVRHPILPFATHPERKEW